MKFTVVHNKSNQFGNNIAETIINACIAKGDQLTDSTDEANYILNFTNLSSPKAIRRKAKWVFVISIVIGDETIGEEKEIRAVCYNTLIKSLANQLIYITPDLSTYFTTPEAGFYEIFFNAEKIYEMIKPIISSNFATDNIFKEDLPREYWNGTQITDSIKHYGKVLDELGILPVPFPLKDFLSAEQLRHLYKIYGITGASYGNLSARESISSLGDYTFWMTGRGVDKSNLKVIGKDILLVKEFDFNKKTAIISMPPDYEKKARVSVDAVEHALIYKTFPGVGAIIHVHAWMNEIMCTRQNYPCGTIELASEVVNLLKHTYNPEAAIVGLKNHGLTITGKNLEEIFSRITGKLIKEVEMFA